MEVSDNLKQYRRREMPQIKSDTSGVIKILKSSLKKIEWFISTFKG